VHNLGGLYHEMGLYNDSEPLVKQALEIYKGLGRTHDPGYAKCLNNYGSLCQEMGAYAKAEKLYRQSLELRKELVGDQHPDYAVCLNNLAGLYQAMGDDDQAEILLRQALEIIHKAAGKRNLRYSTTLGNLAEIYLHQRNYAKAEVLLQETVAIDRAVLDVKHPGRGSALSNLAALYHTLGEYARAERLLLEVNEIDRLKFGDKHPRWAFSQNNLAALYLTMGKYDECEKLLVPAAEIIRQGLSDRHPNYANALTNLGTLRMLQGKPVEAEALFRQALLLREDLLAETFAGQSERQRLAFLQRLRAPLDGYLTTALEAKVPFELIYERVLAWKGAVAIRLGEERIAHDQPELKEAIASLHNARARLARLTFAVPRASQREAWLADLARLRGEKEKLETQLAQASAAFRSLRQADKTGPADIARALPQAAAVVDFFEYSHAVPTADKKGEHRLETRLVAFVVRPGEKPVCVALGPTRSLLAEVSAWRQALQAGDGPAIDTAGAKVAQRVWKPLDKHLAGINSVLVGPDGILARIPVAALPGKRPGSYLIEDLAIAHIVSGRHAAGLLAGNSRIETHGLLALGGIDYGAALDPQVNVPARPVPLDARTRAGFVNLPGTEVEARSITKSFERAFPREPKALLTGADASEQRVRDELARPGAQRYRFIHLASHGFFAPAQLLSALSITGPEARTNSLSLTAEQEARVLGLNPQVLSGIVLAGAKRQPDGRGAGYGILTAEEVSGLDLRGTELVVLSACETGLGELAGGEGVLGLQRAFQVAGARALVASLWRVDDAATTVLMEEFYNNLWQKKLPKLEALRQAQLTVLRQPKRVEQRRKELADELAQRGLKLDKSAALPNGGLIQERSHPAWWAGFILSGDGR
jgi:CHAT domain-containing protein/Tfp pilus assembly protein PilF